MWVSKTIPVKEKTKKVKGMHDDLPTKEEGKIGVDNKDVQNGLLGHDNSDSELGERKECSVGKEDVFTGACTEYGANKEVSAPLPEPWQDLLPTAQCFGQMMAEDKIKEKFNVFKGPENCPSLVVRQTNKDIWNMIKRSNKKLDAKFSAVQRLI
ncbi:hypothetical protein PoB_006935900 [Plakobranchus ocellatus]|uniref:Uncharacterized protein n=1 Tax=Plakobranchus ocellatus TaxID=259542 RepID=A0AAV4DFG6_9GAST|nr:hypothetical protein PoB_006935900 [Plakobranchus ocellatus]